MADERARALRKTLTRHEARLWVHLRALRPQGIHVRRQAPVGPYILDFACLKAKLCIELDGEHHDIGRQRDHDIARDADLARAGLRVMRFWNHEVDADVLSIVETIRMAALAGLEAERARGRRHGAGRP